jgi:hypothetical protein
MGGSIRAGPGCEWQCMWMGGRVWRAFPELRGHSRGECERLVAAACVRYEVSALAAWEAAAGGMVAGGMILAANGAMDADRLMRGSVWEVALVLAMWIGVPLFLAVVSGAIVRVVQVRGALRRLLRVATCRRCGYRLEGLRLVDPPGLDPNPAERRLRCPECGKSWTVLELGISPLDLLAWEARVLPAQVGRMKRKPRPSRAVIADEDEEG